MARSITSRISLDGADDIRKALGQLGDAGSAAFKAIADAVKQHDFNKLQQGARAANQEIQGAKQSSDQLAGSLRVVGDEGQNAGRRTADGARNISVSYTSALVKIGAAAAGIPLIVGGITSALAKAAAETTKGISDAAEKLKITSDQLQNLRSRAEAAGVDTETLEKALGKLRNTIDNAGPGIQDLGNGVSSFSKKLGDSTVTIINGTKLLGRTANSADDAAQSLLKLGLSTKDIVGKGTAEQFQTIFNALAKLKDPVEQADTAVKIFGKDWRELQKIFSEQNVFSKAEEDARKFSEAEIKVGTNLKTALTDLGEAIKFTRDRIGLLFAPSSQTRAEWLTKMIDDARNLLFGFIKADDAKSKLLESGKFDIFKDLDFDKFTALLREKGNDGLATALQLVRDVSSDLATIWNNFLVPAGETIVAAFDTIAQKINEVFGTNITGRFLVVAAVLGSITGAFSLLSGILTSLVGVIGLVALGFAALTSDAPQLDGIKDTFSGIGIDINGLTGTVSTFLSGVWRDFVAAFQGRDIDIQNSWVKDLKEFFTSIPALIAVGVAAFLLFRRGIVAITPIINAFFGTTLNPTQVGAISILGVLSGAFTVLVAALVGLNATLGILTSFFTLIGLIVGGLAALLGLPVAVVAGIVAAIVAAGAAVFIFWDEIKAAAAATWEAVKTAAAATWEAVKSGASSVGEFIASAFQSGISSVQSAFEGLVSFIAGAMNSVLSTIQSVIDRITAAASAVKDFFSGSSGDTGTPDGLPEGVGKFASGGFVRGPGSGTSDSILARLSNGEFVINASAVRHFGTSFFAALNGLRMPKFSTGGIVDGLNRSFSHLALPGFADGGLVGGGNLHPVTIQLSDGRSISGLFGSPDVVGSLQRESVRSQVASTGKSPSWRR